MLRIMLVALVGVGSVAAQVHAQQGPAREISVEELIDALTPPPRPLTRGITPVLRQEDMPHVDLAVEFEFASSSLTAEARDLLATLARALQAPALAGHSFLLAGHTDAVGSHAANDRLSLERAEAVRSYLVGSHGIAPERLRTEGHGMRRLLFADAPEDGRNRRVEVSVIAQ